MKIKKAAVTGSGGFIGSHLVHALLEKGVDVCAQVRYDSVIRNPRLADVWGKLARVEADIRHRDTIQRIGYNQPDVVFHLAAYNSVGQSWKNVQECYETNALGSANVLDVVDGRSKVIYMSTSEVYGRQKEVPWNEETTIPSPNSPYAVTKYAGELHAQILQRVGHPVVIVRPFNTFGPWQSTKAVIGELIVKMLNNVELKVTKGEQTREFIHVSDTVAGLIAAAEADEIPQGPVNIAGGREIKIRDLVTLLHQMTGNKAELKFGALNYRQNEIWRMLSDCGKAHKYFKWYAKMSFEDGLRSTVEWYKANLEKVS